MKNKSWSLLGMAVVLAAASVWATQPPRYSLPYDTTLVGFQKAEDGVAAATKPVAANGTIPTKIPYWVDIVNAESFWNGGQGIYVAVLDTGLLAQWTNYFAASQIATQWGKGFSHDITWDNTIGDFVLGPLRDDRGFITKAFEGSGHGTHVTSTVIGYHFKTASADYQIRGVAPLATIIPVLVLDAWQVSSPTGMVQFTGGFDDGIAAGIQYVADLATANQVKIVINMSFGGSEPAPEIQAAIDYAIARGVIVVASAGNNGEAGMGWPGAYPEVISAAAGGWTEQWLTFPPPAPSRWWLNDVTEKLNTRDVLGNNWQTYLTSFSSRANPALGQSWKDLDVCTPGAAIVGPFKDYFSTDLAYYYLYGTSMATPHVSGIAAIAAQANPGIQQAALESVMKKAATQLPLPSDGAFIIDPVFSASEFHLKWNDHDYGSGWLTADMVLQSLLSPNP